MTTLEQIQAWARAGEGETQEFKATSGQRGDALKTMCGMLNRRGGRVLFGVTRDGEVRGFQVSDKTIEDITAEIQRLEPPFYPVVERVAVGRGLEVVVVSAGAGTQKPYTFRGQAYIRTGSSTLELSRDEYNSMLIERLHASQRWELEVAEGWSVADLDTREITVTVEEAIRRGRMADPATRDPLELLRGLGLLTRDGALRRAAAVLFGREELLMTEYAQCVLRLARFRGTDRTEFLDNKRVNGHAFALLRRAEQFMVDYLPVAGRVVPQLFERVDDPLYPREALREALANAFCHRDYAIGGGSVGVGIYSDRLEVTSTGELHFGLRVEDLYSQHESQPWNPLIASVFYKRGVIETWGRGTLKMVELTGQAGLPRPEIMVGSGAVTVTFLPTRYVPPQMVKHDVSEVQQVILEVLSHAADAGLAVGVLVERLEPSGLNRRQIRHQLNLLKEFGLVELKGERRYARWRLVT